MHAMPTQAGPVHESAAAAAVGVPERIEIRWELGCSDPTGRSVTELVCVLERLPDGTMDAQAATREPARNIWAATGLRAHLDPATGALHVDGGAALTLDLLPEALRPAGARDARAFYIRTILPERLGLAGGQYGVPACRCVYAPATSGGSQPGRSEPASSAGLGGG